VWLPLLLGVGFYIYRNVDWVSWLPTNVLLAFQEEQHGRCTRELLRRFRAQDLSPEQIRKMQDTALSASLNVYSRTPYPAGVPLPVLISLVPRLPLTVWGIRPSDARMDLEGEVMVTALYTDNIVWKASFPALPLDFHMPALEPGTYRIQVRGNAVLDSWQLNGWPGKVRSNPVYKWPISLSTTAVLTKEPLGHLVKPLWTRDLSADILQELTARAGTVWSDLPFLGGNSPGNEFVAEICCTVPRLSAPIAGTVWARPSGEQEFVLVPPPISFPTKRDAVVVHLPETPDFQQATHIDIRIVPDAATAFAAQFEEYFDGVIEWLNVPVEAAVGYPGTDESAVWFRPTRITRRIEEEIEGQDRR